MDTWFVKQDQAAAPGGSSSERAVLCCGDDWCVNGPPGRDCETYFLCSRCAALAPDCTHEFPPEKRSKLTLKQKRAYNGSRLVANLKIGRV